MNVNVDNIVISKLVKRKTNCKYFIKYLDKDIWPLVVIVTKINGYVGAFKTEGKIYMYIMYIKNIYKKYIKIRICVNKV